MPRSPEELGALVRQRRLALGRKQVDVVRVMRAASGGRVVSEPTYRAVETGRTNASDLSLAAISVGLDWPPGALAAIRAGEDPDTIPERPAAASWGSTGSPGGEISIASDGAGLGFDLDELRRLDPETHAQLMALARTALGHARARAGLSDG